MKLNVPLDLETRCWCCEGTGTPDRSKDQNAEGKCDYCEGVGYTLTDLGAAVIEMLNRHKAKLTK